MKGQNKAKKTVALVLGLALAIGGVGCGNFVLTDNEKDLAQTVATVNISESLKAENSGYQAVADDVKGIVETLTNDISKRDLVASFLSTGYQYVESYGYSYEDTFNMLMEGLVSREIMIQYAIAYYLKTNTALSKASCETFVNEELAKATDKEKELYKANPEVLTLKYFLTDGGKDMEEYDRTVYNLKKSLNDSLDSLEQTYITETTEEEHDHEEARTLPTGVGTEKEDYYDTTGTYNVYTGRNTLDACGDYEKQEGSTTNTRQRAYNAFLSNLERYNMVSTSGKLEDTSDVLHLNYYYVELSSLLGQALINKYFETLEENVAAELTEARVQGKYEELYNKQKESYATKPADFDTAMGGVSDTSFILYGLKDYGYVYNILLPFSTEQEVEYTTAKNNKTNSQDDLYNARKNILTKVSAEDLRGSWISAHDHANYSFEKEGSYYFFEDSISSATSTKYEKLKQYAGTYAYNGTVDKTDADEWKATPKKVKDVDEFISIFEKHIKDVSGLTASKITDANVWTSSYNDTKYTNDKDEVQYEKFTYYMGQVEGLKDANPADYFYKDSALYKTISAVNELTFAYSTDPGSLNTYFGYAVSPLGTNFVKEFEYAAQEVVKQGAGTYAVCATDYGWHILFASYVFKGGNVFDKDGNEATLDGYVHQDAVGDNKKEGNFSNLFYESLKTTAVQNAATEIQNNVLNKYKKNSVSLFESRYKDLLELQ